jgi:hypothetical protein
MRDFLALTDDANVDIQQGGAVVLRGHVAE